MPNKNLNDNEKYNIIKNDLFNPCYNCRTKNNLYIHQNNGTIFIVCLKCKIALRCNLIVSFDSIRKSIELWNNIDNQIYRSTVGNYQLFVNETL